MKIWIAAAAFGVLSVSGLGAEDWPAFRGADGHAVWTEDGILEELPEGGLAVRWEAPVKKGYAGPAVRDGRVFVADYERNEDRSRISGTERLLAFDEQTGEQLWAASWDVNYSAIMGSYADGPRATPTVDEERVYVLGAAGDLVAMKVDSGEVVWRKSYPNDYDVGVPIFGFSSAPIVRGEKLIALVGGEPDALVMAFDRKTGEELWRSLGVRSEPGYATPTIVQAAGREQMLIWHPLAISALDPDSGEELWTFEYEAKDTLSVATPVVAKDRLFLTQFYGGSLMLQLGRDDDGGYTATELWRKKGESEMPGKTDGLHSLITTPLFDGDTIWGIDSYGELRALDAATGERIWEDKTFARQGRWGAAFSVRQGDRYVAFTDTGDVVFYRVDREAYQELSRTHLLKPTINAGFGPRRFAEAFVHWGHPAFANRHIFVRNDEKVIAVSLAAPGK